MLIGFVIAPIIIKNNIITSIEEKYSTKINVESVTLNPLTFSVRINNFKLFDTRNELLLSWDQLFIDLNLLPLINKTIELEEISLKNPNLNIIMLSESKYNFSDFINDTDQDSTTNAELHKNESEDSWDFIINEILLDNLTFLFEDRTLDSLAQINFNEINAHVNNFHFKSDKKTVFNFKLNNPSGGSLMAHGGFLLDPMKFNINLNFDQFNFIPINPYVKQFTYLNLESGIFNSTANLEVSLKDDSEIPDVRLQSKLNIENLKLYDTNRDERFFEIKELVASSIKATTNPTKILIGDIVLNELYSRIAIDERQNINLQKIMRDFSSSIDSIEISTSGNIKNNNTVNKSKIEIAQSSTAEIKSDSLDINIDIAKIKIIKSEMLFSDFSLPLKFIANIHGLNGEIIGLSKGNPIGASVELKGTVDEYGLAKIKGNLNPFSPLDFSNIKMNFNNIELNNLSPYSAKFMGYLIEEGKLTLDIEYVVKKGFLNSYSKIFLNKLNLGDEIEVEDGIGFPVKLAIALLKDGDGNIDLDFDVEGDLNDPKTDTGKIIWWAVKRVLTSIVTAPFNFLGNLLGINGDEMEYVDFEIGNSELLPNQIERLINISKAMNERPTIKLEISAGIDTVVDRQTLKEYKAKKIFTERLNSAAKDTLIDPLNVDAAISRTILENIYVESFGDSSLQKLVQKFHSTDSSNSQNKEIDVAGYISQLIKSIVSIQLVSIDELNILGRLRAESIKNHLISVSQIPAERIELTDFIYYNEEDRNWVKSKFSIGAM